MSKKTIRAALEQSLLHNAAMSAALCEEVLVDAADELEESLREDGDDALIALVAEGREVALLMIDKAGTRLRNEAARAQLQQMWRSHYAANVQIVLPMFVDDLSHGMLAVAGVQWAPTP
jgi:creatinine amidohydrolase/Fe(II)-dependent formamide hydrolase-like protein